MTIDAKSGVKKSNRLCLRAIARALASSVSVVDIESCRIVKKGNHGVQTEKDIDVIVKNFLKVTEIIKKEDRFSHFEKPLREAGCSPFLLREILISLVTVGFYGDLDEHLRNDKRIVDALTDNLVVIDRALLGLATLFESSLETFGPTISRMISTNEDDLKYFQMRFSHDARNRGASQDRIDQLNALFNQVVWRTQHQSPEILISRCIQIIDKTAGKFNITPEKRRSLSHQWSTLKNFPEGSLAMHGALDSRLGFNMVFGGGSKATSSIDFQDHELASSSKGIGPMGIGASLMGIGVVITIGGISAGGTGIFVATGGVISLLVGLLMVIIGAFAKMIDWGSKKAINK